MMKLIVPLGLAWLVLSLTACGYMGAGAGETPSDIAAAQTPPPAAAAPHAATVSQPSPATAAPTPAPTPPVQGGQTTSDPSPLPLPAAGKEDDSIRAIGTHADGRLLVKPASKATVAPLGAPSCLGQETDLNWSGDYEAVWESESKTASASIKVLTFPAGFDIVQPNDTPVAMRHFTLEGTDMFAYTPRYTDCHGLETYLFGVSDGGAFPIPLELKPDVVLTNLDELPHRPFQIKNGEIIWTGPYFAGQDYVNIYHFKYDAGKRKMVLQSTDAVKPTDISYDS